MRVLIVGQTYDPPMNGPGVFSVRLAEGLVEAGHRVAVLVPSTHLRPSRTWRNGVRIHAVTAVPIPGYAEVTVPPLPGPEVRRLFDEFQPDVAHIQDHYPLSRSVLPAARQRGCPVLATNHFLPGNITPYMPALLRRWAGLEDFLWRTALSLFNRLDCVTTPTETGARILRQRGLRAPLRPISCGVDLRRFCPDARVDRKAVRARYGLDPRSSLFLFVGRVDREKRLDVLLRGLARLGRTDLQLAVAGRGRDAEAIKALARDLGLGRRAAFLEYVPPEDLPALLNSADIFAMPSDVELQSIATLEAMATGRPVLAADALALPELVRDGLNGSLFRAGDVEDAARRMAELADRRAAWAEMGAASLAIVRPHDLRISLMRYEAVYRDLRRPAPRAAVHPVSVGGPGASSR